MSSINYCTSLPPSAVPTPIFYVNSHITCGSVCSRTHNSSLFLKTQRKKFSPEEDEKLRSLVEKNGPRKWDLIAKEMPQRSGRQCRDRYKNYLIPGYFNGQWSQEEDMLLHEKFKEFGPQWSKMTHFFNNRSANSIKNRWNYFVSRQISIKNEPEQMSSPEFFGSFNEIEENLISLKSNLEKTMEEGPCDDFINSNDISSMFPVATMDYLDYPEIEFEY